MVNFLLILVVYNRTWYNWANPLIWSHLSTIIDHAKANGMYVTVMLSDYKKLLCAQNQWAYDPTLWKPFIAQAIPQLANKTNLAYFEILGDVDYIGGSDGACTVTTANVAQIAPFYDTVTGYIHAADPNHLVGAGGLSHLNSTKAGVPWQAIFGSPNVDLAAIHTKSR